ncbi:S66 peptidase family protein [Rhodohalobacter mucosus]|uniref:LD-carboxypeptidase n=1 Tax=Rhodohalobacter mucosus TaxID=2079485 RepID=A0A316TR59_9BACT|nr:LD-carboxypeptidase [Rhodohalobacter mucosus]PWN07087.1 LD-carboxypeptidase [Rhodohalobacter mucosus]
MKRGEFLKTALTGAVSLPALGRLAIGNGTLTKPRVLREGDTVALTAPAGIVYDENEFIRMQGVLESIGLRVIFGEHVRKRNGYLAGTDRERAEDINRFFADPGVSAIVAVRGGWGSARILPLLDFDLIRANPKIYCGFSDNTTLHLALLRYAELVSFHGPNGTSEWTDLTVQNFKSVLMNGDQTVYRSKSDVETLVSGMAEGRLIGGNLSILTTSLGTPYQPDTEGAILFVEDIGEEPYKVDRMLTHLGQAGMLDGIRGFIFGRCTDCPEPSSSGFTLKSVLLHHIRPLGVPAIMGADIGHDSHNFTIPMGLQAVLDATGGVFKLLEPAVKEA